jgi:hypothetical protein
MQTCVSVISSFAIGNAFTCSKLYTICKTPWSKKKSDGGERGRVG